MENILFIFKMVIPDALILFVTNNRLFTLILILLLLLSILYIRSILKHNSYVKRINRYNKSIKDSK